MSPGPGPSASQQVERGFRAPILVTQPSCLAEFCGPSLLPSLFVVWFAFLRSIFSPTSFLLRLSCCFCLSCPLRAYSLLPTVFSPPSFLPSFVFFLLPSFSFRSQTSLLSLSFALMRRGGQSVGGARRARGSCYSEHSARQLGCVTRVGARNPRSTCCDAEGPIE